MIRQRLWKTLQASKVSILCCWICVWAEEHTQRPGHHPVDLGFCLPRRTFQVAHMHVLSLRTDMQCEISWALFVISHTCGQAHLGKCLFLPQLQPQDNKPWAKHNLLQPGSLFSLTMPQVKSLAHHSKSSKPPLPETPATPKDHSPSFPQNLYGNWAVQGTV